MNHLKQTLDKGFKLEEGPFVKRLDEALISFNVRRQAYYSGTFVGNHVHRTLKVHVCTCNVPIILIKHFLSIEGEYRVAL